MAKEQPKWGETPFWCWYLKHPCLTIPSSKESCSLPKKNIIFCLCETGWFCCLLGFTSSPNLPHSQAGLPMAWILLLTLKDSFEIPLHSCETNKWTRFLETEAAFLCCNWLIKMARIIWFGSTSVDIDLEKVRSSLFLRLCKNRKFLKHNLLLASKRKLSSRKKFKKIWY